jgi:superfamily II DNA or RNA helicase
VKPSDGFLDHRRLLSGPWQAFERDVARLFLANGYQDVRIVGGTGDHGADILAVRDGELWVTQCKHTTVATAPRAAVDEVVSAGKYYGAAHLVVATSRPPSEGLLQERARLERLGLKVRLFEPRGLLQLIARTPEYAPARRTLHPYQEVASTRMREALLDTGRALAVLATGLGKTVVISEVVADLLRDGRVPHDRVLVLAHTRDLVQQLHVAFWHQLPRWVPTHQLVEGETPTFWDGVTFATVQSVHRRRESLPAFGLVVVDEAHHVGAETFVETLAALSAPMRAGVTATPWRGDYYDIESMFGPALIQMGIAEGLQGGFLSNVDYRLFADNVDWEVVQDLSTHRYSLAQLNRRLILPTRDEEAARIVAEIYRSAERRGGIVFSPSIQHAREFAAMLRSFGFRAEEISSADEPRQRDLKLSRFRGGEYDFMATVDLFNEGVDLPDVDLIVFLRVTHSRRIFVQQLGRGLRLSKGKINVVVLDFVTDLRRVADVVDLDRTLRGGDVERLGLGGHLVSFRDESAGTFLREWMLDQASLMLRQDDPQIELPQFNYPRPVSPGGVQ